MATDLSLATRHSYLQPNTASRWSATAVAAVVATAVTCFVRALIPILGVLLSGLAAFVGYLASITSCGIALTRPIGRRDVGVQRIAKGIALLLLAILLFSLIALASALLSSGE